MYKKIISYPSATKEVYAEDTPKNIVAPNAISCSITWVDGRILFKESAKQSNLWYGICSFSQKIWCVAPLDYEKITMITTIYASPHDKHCDKGKVCINFKCDMNRFSIDSFIEQFKDMGKETLGLPLDFGSKVLWFNEGVVGKKWKNFIIPVDGGALKFSEDKYKEQLFQNVLGQAIDKVVTES